MLFGYESNEVGAAADWATCVSICSQSFGDGQAHKTTATVLTDLRPRLTAGYLHKKEAALLRQPLVML
jgi:hypothetical protein